MQRRIIYLVKRSWRIEGDIESFQNKQKLKEYVTKGDPVCKECPVKSHDIKLMCRNPLNFYILIMKQQKENLRKQSHLQLD